MAEPTKGQHVERDAELIRMISQSGVIDFEKAGALVAQVAPELLSGAARASDDRIVSVYEKVVRIWILSVREVTMEQIENLRAIGQELG